MKTHLYVLPELGACTPPSAATSISARLPSRGRWKPRPCICPVRAAWRRRPTKTARDMAAGLLRDVRLLFGHREAPPDVDLTNRGELIEALHEVYGPFATVMDLDRIIRSIWDPRNTPEDSRRYFLNQATSTHDAWIVAHEWAAVPRPGEQLRDGDTITLGFDGSRVSKQDGPAGQPASLGPPERDRRTSAAAIENAHCETFSLIGRRETLHTAARQAATARNYPSLPACPTGHGYHVSTAVGSAISVAIPRPATSRPAHRELVLRLAAENPTWRSRRPGDDPGRR